MSRRPTLLLFGPPLAWMLVAGVGLAATMADDRSWAPVDRTRSTAVGSDRCVSCHPDQHESWHRSYHRTMTQIADPTAVLAPFAGETLDVLGFRATMDRDAQGRPGVVVQRLDDGGEPGEVVFSATVELTVGSHRYQQYVARIDRGGGDQERFRLPVAWHIGEGRWIHMNGAFLTPDGIEGSVDDYLRHLSRWNDNCLFCHNTEPVPGLGVDGRFDTRWAELGIGCEACHGPASSHLERHAWPWRRLLAAVPERTPDGSIAHPGRLDEGKDSAICGRCHGQRIASDLAKVLAEGDGFLPGTDLAEVSRPIFRHSRLASDEPGTEPFAPRFWPDGTPRLSAYEYQALLLSPCYQDGKGLGCMDCHTMHGPDPDKQLVPGYSTQAVCARCHDASTLGPDHGGHQTVACDGCHMPRITYGLLEGMMSHRITSPDPGRWVGRADQPDACTQCHVTASRAWAAEAMTSLGLRGSPPSRPGDEEAWGSRVLLDLHGGDPIQRVLAAHALARPEAVGDTRARMRWLVDALEDEYPAVRWFARRSLRDLAKRAGDPEVAAIAEAFDVFADPARRIDRVEALQTRLGAGPFSTHPERRDVLEARRADRAIEIGE